MSETRDHAKLEKRRLQVGKLFARGLSAPEVARRLGSARLVAYRWKTAWEKGGQAALASKGPAGPKPKLTGKQTQQVVKALLAGPVARGCKTALWTLPRVALLIKELTGVDYHPGHVWRLPGASGFSCQRPERRAIEHSTCSPMPIVVRVSGVFAGAEHTVCETNLCLVGLTSNA